MVLPIYYVFVGSLETTTQIFHQPPYLFPPTPHLENYSRAFNTLGGHFLNSVLITIGVIILILLTAPIAAFALAKLKIKLGKIFSFIFVLVQMLPLSATIIPLYLLFREFRLINTLLGVIIAISSFGVSFIVIMLTSYMRSFPTALIESAEIDGASLSRIYWRIVLPLSVPAITTATIFAFLQGWNNFLFPLILLQDNKLDPLSVRLFNFIGQFGVQWNYLMAGSAIYSIPSIIIVLIGSKFLISGLTTGAFKE
ncbi:Diacetylchitobiose uptake system permease protein DasC [subsurface metagenome]